VAAARPFYDRFGWAYDLLVDDPVEPWADAVEAALRERGGDRRPARILDAGCGTGRHAAELARRGHEIVLADAAPALLEQASARLPAAEAHLGDLAGLRLDPPVDLVACRGVLNDVIDDAAREGVVQALARALRPGGVLVLDVRELEATRARYATETEHTIVAGDLTFTARVRVQDGLLLVHERHERDGEAAEHALTMRPWTREELSERLNRAEMTGIVLAPGVPEQRRDRLFVTAAKRGD
jgi:SAM-dependent methyltransferase